MARVSRILVLLAAAAMCAFVFVDCYETPKPDCAFLCGPAEACPDGYRCAPDGYCKLPSVPDSFSCGPATIDAGVDAAPLPDGGPDAGPDAAPDASIDAPPVDAGIDAM